MNISATQRLRYVLFGLACGIAAAWGAHLLVAAAPVRAQAGNDGLAVRVMKNPEHLGSLAWYRATIPQERQGSPAETVVDGYPAVRDGRSVYVNAGNVSGATLYTNMYILSHTQDAGSDATDIFGQMLRNWRFNTNLIAGQAGECTSRVRNETNDTQCYTDAQCGAGNYCASAKAKVTRDVIRLGHRAELGRVIAAYKETHDNQVPQLSAGTYLQGRSISVWPSWQETLGRELGASLPMDPLNVLWSCESSNGDGTCWNEQDRIFAAGQLAIPVPAVTGARVNGYVYSYNKDTAGNPFTIRLETAGTYAVP